MAKAVFDKAEALRRHREGEKVTDIAEAMGVSKADVYSAIRELKRAKEWDGIGQPAAHADGVSGADKVISATEIEKSAEGTSEADRGAEKPAPKKRGRKKKADESRPDIEEIKAAVMEDVSDDKSDAEEEQHIKINIFTDDTPTDTYFVKFRDDSELTVTGVVSIEDDMKSVDFIGKRFGRVLSVNAAELLYYCKADRRNVFGEICGDISVD